MTDEDAAGPSGDPAVPAPAAPGGARRRGVWKTIGSVALVAVGAVLVLAAFIHVPYVIISPGEATALDDQIVDVTGTRTFPHRGDFLYLTVRVSDDDPNLYRWLFSKLDGDVSVVEKEDVIGCASYAASARLNALLMQESQDIAKSVALRNLGYAVQQESSRVLVVDVLCGGPSEGRIEPGDLVVAVDGTPVTSNEQVRPIIQAHAPGDPVSVTVERGGERAKVRVEPREQDRQPYIGIATRDLVHSELPVDVRIDTRRVSGPSAGLAFTLAIIDDLTPGDLTGGSDVAVTGSIDRDGRVGPVGGVEQKAITARDDGATVMLVPAGEAKAARAAVGDDLRIASVRTIDDALRALRRAGGDPVEPGAAQAPGQ